MRSVSVRLLLCAVFLLLSGCNKVLRNLSTGEFYVVQCFMTGDGTEYTVTVYKADGTTQEGETETYPTESTCASLIATININNIGRTGKADAPSQFALRLAKGAVSTAQTLVYGLDQANLAVQIIAPSSISLTEVDLPGGGYTQYPTSMAATPDGSTIWVTQLAGLGPNSATTLQPPLVSIMNVAQQAFTGSFTLPNGVSPNTIQFSLDGTSAYISNDGSPAEGESGVFANSSVLVVDVATETVTKTIPTPKGAGSEVLSPDGLQLYTIGSNNGIGANNLTVVDTTTNTAAASVPLPDGGFKIFVSPTGTRLYVLWFLGIDVFDTATLQQVATIPGKFTFVTNYAYFTPDGSIAWFCTASYEACYQTGVGTNQIINTTQIPSLDFAFGTP
jgi:DNA-binding beta-propeller fold protein YncE